MVDTLPPTVACPVFMMSRMNPDATAVSDGEVSLTYRQFESRITDTMERLRALGAGPGRRVGVLATNSASYAVLIFALQRLGTTAVLLNLRYGTEWWKQCLKRAECELLIADRGGPSTAIPAVKAVSLDETTSPGPRPGKSIAAGDATVSTGSESTILFTSGSTGDPRGVVLSFGNHYLNAMGSNANMPLDRADTYLDALPFYHVGGLAILFRCAIAGCPVSIMDKFDAGDIAGLIDSGSVTHLSLVPTMLVDLMREWGRNPFPRTFKWLLLGGAPASKSLIEEATSRSIPILTTYGMTETASQVTAVSPNDPPERLYTAGRALEHAELRIVDSKGDGLPSGKEGEIAVRGPILFHEYLEPGGRSPFDEGGWFHTGDLGRIDDDGYLTVLGRRDEMFISGGENIHPGMIEREASGFPGVVECVVVGVPDERWGERPVLLARIDRRSFPGVEHLREHLARQIPHMMVPERIEVVEEFPRTPLGKIDRAAVKEAYCR